MIYALACDILARVLFDSLGNPYSTNWCIFVHFFDYVAWASVYMHVMRFRHLPLKSPSFLDSNRRLIWYMAMMMSIYYCIQSAIQLSYVNENWEMYNDFVFQEGYEVRHTLAISLGIMSFVYFKFIKKKIKRTIWSQLLCRP